MTKPVIAAMIRKKDRQSLLEPRGPFSIHSIAIGHMRQISITNTAARIILRKSSIAGRKTKPRHWPGLFQRVVFFTRHP
jgi:hypothetical protein